MQSQDGGSKVAEEKNDHVSDKVEATDGMSSVDAEEPAKERADLSNKNVSGKKMNFLLHQSSKRGRISQEGQVDSDANNRDSNNISIEEVLQPSTSRRRMNDSNQTENNTASIANLRAVAMTHQDDTTMITTTTLAHQSHKVLRDQQGTANNSIDSSAPQDVDNQHTTINNNNSATGTAVSAPPPAVPTGGGGKNLINFQQAAPTLRDMHIAQQIGMGGGGTNASGAVFNQQLLLNSSLSPPQGFTVQNQPGGFAMPTLLQDQSRVLVQTHPQQPQQQFTTADGTSAQPQEYIQRENNTATSADHEAQPQQQQVQPSQQNNVPETITGPQASPVDQAQQQQQQPQQQQQQQQQLHQMAASTTTIPAAAVGMLAPAQGFVAIPATAAGIAGPFGAAAMAPFQQMMLAQQATAMDTDFRNRLIFGTAQPQGTSAAAADSTGGFRQPTYITAAPIHLAGIQNPDLRNFAMAARTIPTVVPSGPSISLSLACDDEHLSEYQILVRKQLEVFEAQPEDVESNTQGRKKQVSQGQVGIRCRHCAHLPLRQRGRGAVYYPAKLQGVYQAAQNMASSHLCESCQCIDMNLKMELKALRERRDTASGGKQYWADGARALGLYEAEDGLRLTRDR